VSIVRLARQETLVIDIAIDEWSLRLPACVQAKGGGGTLSMTVRL